MCERWSKDHTNALQYALFNGDGFESWEVTQWHTYAYNHIHVMPPHVIFFHVALYHILVQSFSERVGDVERHNGAVTLSLSSQL